MLNFCQKYAFSTIKEKKNKAFLKKNTSFCIFNFLKNFTCYDEINKNINFDVLKTKL
jgi:hypothetical protein